MDKAGRKARTLWWLGLGLLAAALAGLAACAVNPVTGQQELVLMSEQQELAMGARYFPQTTQINNALPPEDPQLQGYVAGLGRRLAAASHRPGIPWEFNVVNSSQVNAYALPGGKISFTRGLLTKLRSEDELASVAGHEIGHVTARHSVAQYTNRALISLAVVGVAAALSDSRYGELGVAVAGAAGGLLLLGYSRDQERQADELGHEYMTKNGYNPRGTVEVFRMFKTQEKEEPGFIAAMLSSHPLTGERIETAQRRARTGPAHLIGQPLKVEPYQRALARQMDRAPAYQAMDQGDVLAGKERLDQAQAQYQRAIALYPREGLFHARLALARLRQNRPQAALEPARMGARLSPQVFMPLFVEGMTCYKLEDYRQAAASLGRADALLPEHAGCKLFLAGSYEKLGNRAQAAQAYRQVAISDKGELGRAARARLMALGYKVN